MLDIIDIQILLKMGAIPCKCGQCEQVYAFKYNYFGQTQMYCSNACRQKAYRIRHGQRYDKPGRPVKT
jgi:ferredoxin